MGFDHECNTFGKIARDLLIFVFVTVGLVFPAPCVGADNGAEFSESEKRQMVAAAVQQINGVMPLSVGEGILAERAVLVRDVVQITIRLTAVESVSDLSSAQIQTLTGLRSSFLNGLCHRSTSMVLRLGYSIIYRLIDAGGEDVHQFEFPPESC